MPPPRLFRLVCSAACAALLLLAGAASAQTRPVEVPLEIPPWDIQMRDAYGIVRTLAHGALLIVADVTKRIE